MATPAPTQPPETGVAALGGSYILPLRREVETAVDLAELTAYLRSLAPLVEVVVVDASAVPLFEAHARAWSGAVLHLRPDPAPGCRNGKVASVLTGLRRTSHGRVVIADDDVRYDERTLAAVLRRLEGCSLVRPQNYFDPCPWHATLDTGRSLLNRFAGGDWPGTLAIRTEALAHGYRDDVLFENLELVRTVRAGGGREAVAGEILVRRLPPSVRQYLSQRIRQAYDEFARPWRFAAGLVVIPALAELVRRRRWRSLLGVAVAVSGAAETGRRRDGGAAVFPVAASLLAPLWVVERGVCSWLALAVRMRGGVRYRGARIRVAASPMRELRRTQFRGRYQPREARSSSLGS